MAVAALFASAAMAQNVNTQSFKDKIAKAETATKDPKKGAKAASWIALGDSYVAAAGAYTAMVYQGMGEAEMMMAVGKYEGESVPMVTFNNTNYKHFSYPQVDLYVTEAGQLEIFQEKAPIVADAFAKALAAYTKAVEIDAKAVGKVKAALEALVVAARAAGANAYAMGDFANACDDFTVAANAATNPALNSADANELVFYAAVTALQAEKYDDSVELLKQLIEAGDYRNGDVYNYLGIAYTSLGKTELVEPILVEGLEKFQANQSILHSLISYYIGAKEDPGKVIPYIKKAQEESPEDPNLLIAEGLAYENMGDTEKAVEAYGKAVQVKPDFFDAAYNYALATYRQAGNMIKALGEIDLSNQSELDAKEGEAINVFKQSAERMEKAHAIDPSNRDAMEVLRSVYFRLSGNRLTKDDPSYGEKYNKYKAMLN